MAMKAEMEVLHMRAQNFLGVTEHGVEAVRQMAFLVDQGHDALFSKLYRSVKEALTGKLETEASNNVFQGSSGAFDGTQPWWRL